MEDKARKRKRKSNGETDGSDADIYGKAAAEATVRLVVTSSFAVRRLHRIVEVAKDVTGILQTMNRTKEIAESSERMVGELSAVAKVALDQSRKLSLMLLELRGLLSNQDSPEALACVDKIDAITRRRSEK